MTNSTTPETAPRPSGDTEASLFEKLLAERGLALHEVIPPLPVNFSFRWRAIPFSARLSEQDSGARLRMVGDLGPVPFTAERPLERGNLLSLARWSGDTARYQFMLGKRNRLNLIADTDVAAPADGTRIVTAATLTLLDIRPYLELAQEMGVRLEEVAAALPACE